MCPCECDYSMADISTICQSVISCVLIGLVSIINLHSALYHTSSALLQNWVTVYFCLIAGRVIEKVKHSYSRASSFSSIIYLIELSIDLLIY